MHSRQGTITIAHIILSNRQRPLTQAVITVVKCWFNRILDIVLLGLLLTTIIKNRTYQVLFSTLFIHYQIPGNWYEPLTAVVASPLETLHYWLIYIRFTNSHFALVQFPFGLSIIISFLPVFISYCDMGTYRSILSVITIVAVYLFVDKKK